MGKTSVEHPPLTPRLKKIFADAEHQPSPAIALTIATVERDAKQELYSLLGWNKKCKLDGKVTRFVSVMRRPKTNPTHPNILSSPTDRIPLGDLNAMLNESTVQPLRAPCRSGYTFFEPCPVSSHAESGHHPVIYAVDSLLAKKMGVAEALEAGEFPYRAWVAAVLHGKADYTFQNGRVSEPMRMANIFVEVDEKTMEQIPYESAAYSEIRKLRPFVFRNRHCYGIKGGEYFTNPETKMSEEGPSDVIDGLCLPSTIAVLNQFEEPLIEDGK